MRSDNANINRECCAAPPGPIVVGYSQPQRGTFAMNTLPRFDTQEVFNQ
jgi:hypothetical protein